MHPLHAHIQQLVHLSDAQFEQVLSHFTPKKFKKHQFLVQAGELVLYDHFVLEGCLKAWYTDAEGREHILQFALKDWWITDYQAYFRRLPANLQVDCIEASEVLCLSLDNREKLCAEHRAIEYFFRQKLSAGYIALQQRILSMLTTDVATRYAQLLETYPTLHQKVPKTLIAAYLGVSRETLSRLRG